MHPDPDYLKKLLLLIICASTPFFSWAQQEQPEEEGIKQLIQEFTFSQTVYLQELREVQQTAEAMHTSSEGILNNSLAYEIEYGITDWVQLSAGYAHVHQHSRSLSYTTDWLEAGTMLSLLSTSRQAASLSIEAEFPLKKPRPEVGNDEAEISYTPTLLYARELGNAQLHLNAGAELAKDERRWFYNAAAVYGSGHWHPLLEVNVVAEDETDWYLGPGLVLNGTSGWEGIVGIRHSLKSSDWDVSFKLLYEFNAGPAKQ